MRKSSSFFSRITAKLKEGLKNLFAPEEIEVYMISKDGKIYRHYKKIARKKR